jgi:hypothetical protein
LHNSSCKSVDYADFAGFVRQPVGLSNKLLMIEEGAVNNVKQKRTYDRACFLKPAQYLVHENGRMDFLARLKMKRRLFVIIFLGLTYSLFASGKKDTVEEDAVPPPPVVEDQFPEVPVYEEVYTPPPPVQQNSGIKTLAVLPFTGVTNGDGEALALLFSNNFKLRSNYSVVPMTRNVQQRVRSEQQNTTVTDIQSSIDLVMVGIVRNIRNNNVLLVNIVERTSRQLIAGDFRIYRDPSELQTLIPAMIDYMIIAAQKPRENLQKLAVTPFDTPQPGVSAGEAEMLALLLSAEIASSGQYAVLPRMEPLLQAMDQINQMGTGVYDTSQTAGAEFVLTGSVITLGTKNLFVAQIERIADSGVIHGAEESYETSSDGILQVIPRLSQTLTGVASGRAIPPPVSPTTAVQPASSTTPSTGTQQPYIPSGGDYRPTVVVPQGTTQPTTPGTTTGGTTTAPGGSTPYTPPSGSGSSIPQYYNPMVPR